MSRTKFVRCGIDGCRTMTPEGTRCEAHRDGPYTEAELDAICERLLGGAPHQAELKSLRDELDKLTEN